MGVGSAALARNTTKLSSKAATPESLPDARIS